MNRPRSAIEEREATLGLLGRVLTRRGIEESEPGHAPGRLAQDLQRDIAAHRQARQGESLERRRGQDVLRNAAHRIRAGVVGDPAVGVLAQALDLRLPEQRVAQEPGNEDKRRPVHRAARRGNARLSFTFSSAWKFRRGSLASSPNFLQDQGSCPPMGRRGHGLSEMRAREV